MSNLIGGFFVLFVVYLLLMAAMSPLLGLDDIPHAMTDLQDEYGPLGIFFLAVIAAPIIEEFLFRFSLRWFTRGFAIAFFIFSIGFAALHIFNFTLQPSDYWKIPFLIIPQTLLGFYLGFVRMQFSWLHGVLVHMLNNLIPTCLLLASEAMGLELQCLTFLYH